MTTAMLAPDRFARTATDAPRSPTPARGTALSNDPLTGLYTRRFFMELGEARFSEARRHGYSCSLLFASLDRYDTMTDRDAEESVIVFAELLRACIRREDIVARVGEGAFAILMLHCDIENAFAKAEALRTALAGMGLGADDTTASFGVTTTLVRSGLAVEAVLGVAAEAARMAAASGGDRVQILEMASIAA